VTPTERLIALLQAKLLDLLPKGTQIEEPIIDPSRGYWTHRHQDVMAWQGSVAVRLPGSRRTQTFQLGSWDTLTTCTRRGFVLVDQRSEARNEVHFEAYAKPRRRDRLT
jgi:hypothetical protein